MKSDIPNKRNLVRVDSKTADILKKKYSDFKQIFESEKAGFAKQSQTEYYIVSTKYINQWTEFCRSNQSERQQPNPMNQDLMDAGGQLRQGLVQTQDFEIVNRRVYNILKGDKALELYRQAVIVNNQKKVPIYLDTVLYYMKFTGEILKRIEHQHKILDKTHQKQMMIKPIAVSRQQTGQSLLKRIFKIEGLDRVKGRLWKNSKTTSVTDVYQYFKPLIKRCFRFPGIGKFIEDMSTPLQNLNIQEGDYFIAQIIQIQTTFYLKTQDQAKCQYCNKMQKLKVECPCKKVKYCNENCMEKDKRFHIKNCRYAQQQQLNEQVKMSITPSSSLGKVGLTNLGNTCFMNSCLQCLSNTTLLTDYFLKSYYQKQINKTNPLGSQGRLAKNYAKFIKNMWCQSQSTFSPYNLKGAVAKLNPIFSGYAQHDSQQFFSYLVDGIHEDLNRVLKKPYVQSVDSKGRQDHVVALESWIAYTQRNQSVVVDLMTGQYKSKVICPTCNLQSITFDPFTTVSLPIPEQATTKTLKYYVIFSNNHQQAWRMSFAYTKADTKQWLETAVRNMDRNPEDFMFYVLTVYQNIYNFQITSKTQILHKVQVQNKNVFLLQLTPEQKNIKDRVQITTQFCKNTYRDKQFDNLWFKRPFFFERQKTTVLTMYKRMLQFIYPIQAKRKQMTFKNYEQFQKKMLQQRLFTLVLKSKKSLQRFYNRVEVKFAHELILNQDDLTLQQIAKEYNLPDCELDVRFYKQNSKFFEFDKLKSFQDKANKNQKKSNYRQGKQDYSTVTIDQCFSVFQQKEQLQHGNEWYCPRCKEHRLATKQMTIYKAPQILILHLKRFKNKGILRKQKNQTNVIFPLELNMQKYVIDPEPMSSYINELKKQQKYIEPSYPSERGKSEPRYQLYAISNHYGGLGGGHYTAYAKNNGKWYQFNDSSVRGTSENQIKGSGAYMLFYKRTNGLKIK